MKSISLKETRKLLFTPIVENNPIAIGLFSTIGVKSSFLVSFRDIDFIYF